MGALYDLIVADVEALRAAKARMDAYNATIAEWNAAGRPVRHTDGDLGWRAYDAEWESRSCAATITALECKIGRVVAGLMP